MPRSGSSSPATAASESMSSASGDCCDRGWANARRSTSWLCKGPARSARQTEGEDPLLPERRLPARIERGVVVPFFLTAQDHPWLGVLMEEIDRFRGRPRRELNERLRAPLPCAAPFAKSRAATSVLLQMWRAVENGAVAAAAARESVFVAAAGHPGHKREHVLAEVASSF